MITYNKTYNLILKRLVARLPILYGNQLRRKNPKILKSICIAENHPEITAKILLEYIDSCTKNYISTYSFNYKIYWVLMELQDYPRCDFGHILEPKKNFRVRVDPLTLNVSSNLAKRCNNHTCAQNNPKTRNAAIQHFRDVFGVDNPYQSHIIIEKIRQTNKDKFGYEHAAQSPKIKELEKQRCLEKYGVDNCWKLPKVKEHANRPDVKTKRLSSLKKYNREHYGVDWYVQSDDFKQKMHATNGTSKEEKQVIEWLKTIVDENDILVGSYKIIPPRQLDAYIISKKIGIEFNGTFYHSINRGCDINYHLMKTQMCEAKGIKLIHIWENDWLRNKDTVKSFITHMINDTFSIDDFLICRNDGLYEIDRSKINKCAIPSTYEIVGESEPQIVMREKNNKEKFEVPDCGKLILKDAMKIV